MDLSHLVSARCLLMQRKRQEGQPIPTVLEPVVEFIEEQKAQDGSVTLEQLIQRIRKAFGLDVHRAVFSVL